MFVGETRRQSIYRAFIVKEWIFHCNAGHFQDPLQYPPTSTIRRLQEPSTYPFFGVVSRLLSDYVSRNQYCCLFVVHMSKRPGKTLGSFLSAHNVKRMAFDQRIGSNWHPNNYRPLVICDTYANTSKRGDHCLGRGVTRREEGDHFCNIDPHVS